MSGISLINTNLKNANLSHADMRDTDLSGANLDHTNLESANLKNADFREATLKDVNILHSHIIKDARLSHATRTKLEKMHMRKPKTVTKKNDELGDIIASVTAKAKAGKTDNPEKSGIDKNDINLD